MFGNLRKKLSSAIQEGIVITESIQQQYRQRNSAPSTPATPPASLNQSINSSHASSLMGLDVIDVDVPPHLNIAAGGELLEKYEQDWQQIHVANQSNSEKAEIIANQIERITQTITTQHTNMTDLITCLSGVPALVETVRADCLKLQEITELSAEIEKQLEQLINLCEECDLQEFMLQKQCELSQHKQQKMNNLEIFRQKVAAEHQEKISKHEQHLRKIQLERQAVFDDAFRGDMEEFKRKGALPRIATERKPSVPLEEVVLEDPDIKDALEEFLNG